jgi:hypothetical protein
MAMPIVHIVFAALFEMASLSLDYAIVVIGVDSGCPRIVGVGQFRIIKRVSEDLTPTRGTVFLIAPDIPFPKAVLGGVNRPLQPILALPQRLLRLFAVGDVGK